MEFKGKVIGVHQNEMDTSSVRVTVDTSDYGSNGVLISARKHAEIDVPAKNASAYYVGRQVTGSLLPVGE